MIIHIDFSTILRLNVSIDLFSCTKGLRRWALAKRSEELELGGETSRYRKGRILLDAWQPRFIIITRPAANSRAVGRSKNSGVQVLLSDEQNAGWAELQGCQSRGCWGMGFLMAIPDIGRSVNPISTKLADYHLTSREQQGRRKVWKLIICQPGWDRVNWSANIWDCHEKPQPQHPRLRQPCSSAQPAFCSSDKSPPAYQVFWHLKRKSLWESRKLLIRESTLDAKEFPSTQKRKETPLITELQIFCLAIHFPI